MADARIERIERDPWLAAQYLRTARTFYTDGARQSNATESRQVLLHNASVAACDAVLAINGREVVGSDGGHRLRMETALPLLGDDLEDLAERLDDTRIARIEASYRAAPVPESDHDTAVVAVRELIDLAAAHVEPHLPPHLSRPE